MKAAPILRLFVLALIITTCSCGLLMMRPRVRISSYRGDGTIAHIQHPVNPGFKVDFESFSLTKPYVASYTLDALPKPRWHSPYQAGLVVQLAEDEDKEWPEMPAWLTTGAAGTLTIALEGRNGLILLEGEAQVAKMYWSRFVDDLPYGMMYFDPWNTQESIPWTFPSDQKGEEHQQPWTLHVDYRPGPESRDRAARIRFMAGGRE